MAQPDAWSVGRLLQWTTDFLKRHGADSPRLDAEVLLAEAIGCQRIQLYTAFDDVPKEEIRAAFRELVRRRAEGTPVAYLVGRREFYSLSFQVTPDVLIPRPETEFLVIALIDLAKARAAEKPGEEVAICDVGTGSGIIAVAAAKHIPSGRVLALDTSPAALDVARANAEAHGVAGRIEFLQSDLLGGVPDGRRFDFIASNPPYVSEAELAALAPGVRDFEPRAALLAGPRGTEVIDRLLPQAAQRLLPGGSLLIEISPMIHDAALALLRAEDRLEPGPTIKDFARLPRVIRAQRKA
jgi:release factor glutamine methyltransferase